MSIIRQTYASGSHTSLNQLSYGEFSTGREPIITKRIPYKDDTQAPSSTGQITRRVNDLERIATILTRPPGLKFIGNETALNASSVKFKTKYRKKDPTKVDKFATLVNGVAANLWNTVKIVGSTLAQVPVNGTGTHFVKGFAGRGDKTYAANLSMAAHKLALFNGQVFGDEIANDSSAVPNRAFHQTPEDNFVINSIYQGDVAKESVFTDDETGKVLKSVKAARKKKKETRLALGDPGMRVQRVNYAGSIEEDTVDKKNMLPPTPERINGDVSELGARDMIKFNFEVVTPRSTDFLYFRAYLDDFSDNYSGQWSPIKYIGRAENFYTYEGFDRSVSLSFKIAAQTRYEMRPLYQKMVYLASTTAPSYTKAGYMTPTFVNVTVGSYLDQVPCIIESVDYKWNLDYPWEIAMSSPEAEAAGEKSADFDQQELPMILDCSLQLKPLHQFLPQTGLMHYISSKEETDKGFIKSDPTGRPGSIIPQP